MTIRSACLILSVFGPLSLSFGAAWADGHGGDGGGGGHHGGGGHDGGGHHGGGHHHGGHHHHHSSVGFYGIGIGGFYPGYGYGWGGWGGYGGYGWGLGYGFGPGYYGGYGGYGYGFGAPYYSPYYYRPPVVTVPVTPPVYIQRQETRPPLAPPQPANYWYYCRNPDGYYPYVKKCAEGWLQVPPRPQDQ